MRPPEPLYTAVIVLRESGEVLFLNPSAQALTGISPGDVWSSGDVLARLFPEEGDRGRAAAVLHHALLLAERRGSLRFQAILPGRDGLTRPWCFQICRCDDFLGEEFMVSFQPRPVAPEPPADPVGALRAAALQARRTLDDGLASCPSLAQAARSGDSTLALFLSRVQRAQGLLASLEAPEASMGQEPTRRLG